MYQRYMIGIMIVEVNKKAFNSDKLSQEISGIFEDEDVVKMIRIIDTINSNAIVA